MKTLKVTRAWGLLARRALLCVLLLGSVAGAAWVWTHRPRPITVSAGQHPEELVYVRSTDDVVNGGAFFSTPARTLEEVAVIWVQGWGTNFYYPTYTMIGRALAARGLTTISVNTRMHDLGTSATYRGGRRVRGGGYWGIQSEQDLDIAAWVDFAEARGYPRVVLAGHSAGWAAVAAYRVRTQDPRVVGIVLASGTAQTMQPLRDQDVLDKARQLEVFCFASVSRRCAIARDSCLGGRGLWVRGLVRRFCICVVILFGGFVTPESAQSYAIVQGRVVAAADGSALPGVTVTIQTASGESRQATTDAAGHFAFTTSATSSTPTATALRHLPRMREGSFWRCARGPDGRWLIAADLDGAIRP